MQRSDTMSEDKLNGSVDLLAKAMRKVFVEAVEEGTAPLREDVAGLREDVGKVKSDVDGLKSDVEDGFKEAAEERRRLRSDMENGFAELRPPK